MRLSRSAVVVALAATALPLGAFAVSATQPPSPPKPPPHGELHDTTLRHPRQAVPPPLDLTPPAQRVEGPPR